MLGPLQDNGGHTWTHALLPGSPAIDAIPNIGCNVATDQRGVSRPQGTNCDIGAFELGVLHLNKFVDNPTPVPGEVITITIQVSNGLTETITGGVISDTLPVGLNFIGPITLDPPLSGTVGLSPPTLVTDLMIGTEEQVTVTFPVSVSYGIAGNTVITNTAWVTSTEVITPVLGSAIITITNVAPVGVDDPSSGLETAFTTDEKTPFTTGSVLSNDRDDNGDTLSVSALDTSSTLGLVSDNGNGTFNYDPNDQFDDLAPGEQAIDVFTYTLSDGVLTDTATVTITIQGVNESPIVDAGPNQKVDEGDLVQFNGSFTDTSTLTSLLNGETIHWDFGDGKTATGTLTPTHTFLDDEVYTVTLTITDTYGGVGSDWLLVTVENVSPTLSELLDQETLVGEIITVTGTFTDPGTLDTQTVVITWAEGVTETLELDASTRQFSFAHAYAEPGEYLVSVRVTDKDGGWDQKSFNITVSLNKIYLPLVRR